MPSLVAHALNLAFTFGLIKSNISISVEGYLQGIETNKAINLAPAPIPASLTASLNVLEGEVDAGDGQTFRVIRFRSQSWKEGPQRKAILYLPGGSFFYKADSTMFNFLAVLLQRLPSHTIFMVNYGLAPTYESNFVTSGVLKVFRHLEGQANDWTAMGDSAGGNLALVLTNSMAKEKGKATTIQRCVLISGLVDIRLTPEVEEAARSDVMLSIAQLEAIHQLYVSPGVSISDPSVSPIEGVDALAHSGVVIQSWMGTRDLCHVGVIDLEKKLKHIPGIEIDFHLLEGLCHDYPIISQWIPEAKAATDGMVELLSK